MVETEWNNILPLQTSTLPKEWCQSLVATKHHQHRGCIMVYPMDRIWRSLTVPDGGSSRCPTSGFLFLLQQQFAKFLGANTSRSVGLPGGWSYQVLCGPVKCETLWSLLPSFIFILRIHFTKLVEIVVQNSFDNHYIGGNQIGIWSRVPRERLFSWSRPCPCFSCLDLLHEISSFSLQMRLRCGLVLSVLSRRPVTDPFDNLLTVCLIHFDSSFSFWSIFTACVVYGCLTPSVPSVPSRWLWRTQYTKHRSMRFARMLTLLASASVKIHHTLEVNTKLECWQYLIIHESQTLPVLLTICFLERRLNIVFSSPNAKAKLASLISIHHQSSPWAEWSDIRFTIIFSNLLTQQRNNIDQRDSTLSLHHCSTRPPRNEKRPATQCILGFWLV